MSSPKAQEKGFLSNPTVRVAGSLVLLGCALGYGWSVLSHYTRGLPPKPFTPLAPPASALTSAPAPGATPVPMLPPGLDWRAVMPSPEERRKIMNDLMGRITATEDQKKKIEEIWVTNPQPLDGASLVQRVAESQNVLDQGQLMQLRPLFFGQVFKRVEGLRKVMKPQDYVTFQKRLVTALQPPPSAPQGAPPAAPPKR